MFAHTAFLLCRAELDIVSSFIVHGHDVCAIVVHLVLEVVVVIVML